MNLKTSFIILALLLASYSQAQLAFDQFKSDIENKVKGLAEEMSQIYRLLCTSAIQ